MSNQPIPPPHPTPEDAPDRSPSSETPDRFLRTEHHAMQLGALADDWRELTRRQNELRMALQKAVAEAEAEQENLAATAQTLRKALDDVSESESGTVPDAATVRELRQRLHEAGIHLALFDRRRGHAGHGRDGWQSLSFSELSRLGFAFLLPLIIALLVAAGVVAVALELALGM